MMNLPRRMPLTPHNFLSAIFSRQQLQQKQMQVQVHNLELISIHQQSTVFRFQYTLTLQ